ncbi:MAG: CNNM domain-containing protein [Candidatus Eisenbacteria bacterium]|jgi:putative hemolysin|nr:CNNM domain-containing protein [Candidatus Eisenbacteria bacterium]
MILLGFLVIASIVAAGLFSGMESAFLACPRLKVRHLARKGLPGALRMERALHHPEPYLTTLLVGTNLAVIGGTVAATRLANEFFPESGEMLATGILTPVFLLLSEIIPKSYFLTHARAVCIPMGGPLEALRTLLRPFAVVVGAPARLLSRTAGRSALPSSREELVLLTRPGVSSVRLSHTISRLLERGIATARRVAGDVMIPRERVVTLPADFTLARALPVVRAAGVAHYPLERSGRWIGFVHVFDLLEIGSQASLSELASRLPEVDQDASLEEILDVMRDAAEHVACVVHERAQVGLITLEDVMRHLTQGLEETPA